VLLLAITASPVAARATASAPLCDGKWHLESHPQDGQVLHAVASRWIQGAWAVGSVEDPSVHALRTYIEHLNGVVWKRFPSPNVDPRPEAGDNALFGVVGIGADIWAVGSSVDPGDQTHPSRTLPLAMHYGGSSWVVVPTDPSTGRGTLLDVWQTPTGDVWAVGESANGSHPIAERWDGSAWHDVPVPDPSPLDDGLSSISGSTDRDIWAVGTGAGGTETLADHWDGRSWTRVATPDPSARQTFADVSVRRDGLAFAVGGVEPSADVEQALIGRYGTGWTVMAAPDPTDQRELLVGLDRGPHNLQKFWAVGWRQAAATTAARPLILRLAGGAWHTQRAPIPYPGGDTRLADVAVFGRATFDAVGAVAVGAAVDPSTGTDEPLIMRRCAPPV
jgi:hypothetical protein